MKRALGLAMLALLFGACAKRGMLRTHKTAPPRPTPVETPGPEVAPQPSPAPYEVKVKKGENLWVISRRELGRGARFEEIASLNSIREPWWIHPGDRLKVPSAGASASPSTSPSTGSGPPSAGSAQASGQAGALGAYDSKVLSAPKKGEKWPKRPNAAFTMGEKLVFAVQYFKATAGYATLSIPEIVTVGGRPCLHITAEAQTHPFFETFFKVRDRIETFIDAESLISWRYEKHIHEGGYKADAFYLFDQRKKRMLEPDKGKDVEVAAETQDVLSCFYWARTLPLVVGQSYFVKVAADDMKNYELKVDVLRKEKASTLAGDFDCIVVQPHLKFEGVFQQKGEVFIWLTDDERRIPVKIRSKIVIGSININLQDADWVQPAAN